MKRVGFLYEKACDLDLIRHAIRQAAKGKTQKHYIAKVLANEEAYAMRIKEMLETNTLRLSPNRQIVLFDHSCMKERVITVPKFFPGPSRTLGGSTRVRPYLQERNVPL